MKEIYFRQCELEKLVNNKRIIEVSWIPEKYAVKGKVLKLKEAGSWDNGWKVIAVSDIRISQQEIEKRSRDYLSQRSASDI